MHSKGWWAAVVAWTLVFLAAFSAWFVFRPGLLSPDSIEQYRQAVEGRYSDWHPPEMAVALGVVMALGGDIGLVTLLQSIAGCAGLYALALAAIRFAFPDRGLGASARLAALGVFALFLWPMTPFLYYAVTFWKDAWLMFLLLWVGALGLELYRRAPEMGRGRFGIGFALWLALVVLALHIRHNMLVAMPALSVAAYVLFRRRGVRPAWPSLFVPAGLYMAVTAVVYGLFSVERTHPEDQVMALDLVGLCVMDDRYRAELPHTSRYLEDERYRARYVVGYVNPIIYGDERLAKPGYAPGNHEPLAAEYWRAWRRFPWALLALKLRAYGRLLDPRYVCYLHERHVVPNPYGLAQDPQLEPVRRRLFRISDVATGGRRTRWVGAVHLGWLLLGAVWAAAAIEQAARRRDGRFAMAAALLLAPLSYALSYLPATIAPDFRYLYPATVTAQAVSLPLLAAWAWRRARDLARALRLLRPAGPARA